MSKWEGFTDDELKRLNRAQKTDGQERNEPERRRLKTTHKFPEIQKTNKESRNCSHIQNLINTSPAEKAQEVKAEIENVAHIESEAPPTKPDSQGEHLSFAASELGNSTTTGKIEDINFLIDEHSVIKKEMQNLEKFRDTQKKIEELNKRKKAMLTTAILEKEKRTKAESKKLLQIKKELQQLDSLVLSDISIIRDKIEEASRNYLISQKRYEIAEKDFIEAKVDLHKRQELKEQLTEHLYTVIHQNEMRKAAKLNELMNKLEIEEKECTEKVENAHAVVPINSQEQQHIPKPEIQSNGEMTTCKDEILGDVLRE